ncbi:MAG: kinase [Eubacterium sp.]
MIITKTPFRISFFGGGTDMEEYFKENNGAVLSTTFDKYNYVIVRHLPRFFDYTNEIVYSKIERIGDNIDEILHPAVREAMKMLDMKEIRLSYEADLPAKTGLGTSSSFAVGMLLAFHTLKGEYIDKEGLAKEAIYLERVLCDEKGGWQDQIAAAYGGLNRIDFQGDTFSVKPLIISPKRKEELNDNLFMIFTGFTRFSSDIQKINQQTSMQDKKALLDKMYSLVDEAEIILTDKNKNLDDFGRLLDVTWKLKSKTGKAVSTDTIDYIYNKGIESGALGGKLLGAGGGGFMLFYVPKENHEKFMAGMKEYMYVPFRFENEGTQVIHYRHESWTNHN